MNNKLWTSLSGKKIENIRTKILNDLHLAQDNGYQCKYIVGTDSQRHGDKIVYITVIAFIRQGNGGLAYYTKEVESIPGINDNVTGIQRRNIIQNNISTRLWNETVKAVEVATWLDTVIEDTGYKVNEIHCDVNPNKKYKSNEMLKAIQGYIQGVGYTAIVKPYGWVASQVSNRETK